MILPPVGEVTTVAISAVVNEVLAHAFAEVAEDDDSLIELVAHGVDVTTHGDPLGDAFWSEEVTLDERVDQLAGVETPVVPLRHCGLAAGHRYRYLTFASQYSLPQR